MPRITSLHIYPVKSLQGIRLQESQLGIRGLEFDRTWMVADHTGKFITQRHFPVMATIQTSITDTSLILSHPDHAPLQIPLESSWIESQEVTIWHDQVQAFDEGGEAAEWLTQIIGVVDDHKVRLFRYAPDHVRPVKPKDLDGEVSHTAFADGFPFLVTSLESLGALNEKLTGKGSQAVGMERFRPNIVIEGLDPFEEDRIQTLEHASGAYALGLRKPCQRCHVTTIDQTTGLKVEPKEPLRTLVQMNTQPGKDGGYFGQNAILLNGEGQTIRVGDELRSLS